jgi:hypothetical protein
MLWSSKRCLPFRFPDQNSVIICHRPHVCNTPWRISSLHPCWCDCLNSVWQGVKTWCPSWCNFLQPPVTSTFFGPDIQRSCTTHHYNTIHNRFSICGSQPTP